LNALKSKLCYILHCHLLCINKFQVYFLIFDDYHT
jgi:hypothetical protein